MTDDEIGQVYAMLISAGYCRYHATWMAVSCPSIDTAATVIASDIASGHIEFYRTEPTRSEP